MSSHFRPTRCRCLILRVSIIAGAILLPDSLTLGAGQRFRRGDSNADAAVNITDAVHSLGFLFLGKPDRLPCQDAADSNDDGKLDLSDPVRTLGYLFLGSPAMPPPFGVDASTCGEDPTADGLDCESFAPCLSSTAPPAPPLLAAVVSPTRAASVEVRGTTGAGLMVKLTGGRSPLPVQTRAGPDGAFVATIELSANRLNRLFALGVDTGGRQSAPAVLDVIQDSQPPFVYIDSPADLTEIHADHVAVTGRVSDLLSGFQGLSVTVNGHPAAVAIGIGTNGTFELQDVPLEPSPNLITVVATDAVGNTASREAHVLRAELPADLEHIELASGDGQPKVPIHTALPQPLVVRARRADGQPFQGKLVTFKVIRSDGRLASRQGTALADQVMTLAALTDDDGLARVHWTLGGDAGCGNNRVKATCNGLAGTVLFCASAAPGPATQINVGTGNNQQGETGAPAREALRAWVNDGCNGIPGVPVTFRVKVGGGNVNGADSVTVDTGPTGHAQANFTFGASAGNQTVEADFAGNLTAPATFQAHALLRDESRPTTFTGFVLDNAARPIQGAICILEVPGFEGVQTRTSIDGRFSLESAGAGPASLAVEGSTATHVGGEVGEDVPLGSFPALTYEVTLVPNAENSLSSPVLLPPLDPDNAVNYDGSSEAVLHVKGVEGLEMLVAAGTTVTLRDGTRVGPGHPGSVRLSLNQVHYDDVPMPMPDGAAPLLAWTLQPRQASFDPPIRIHYPNVSALPPGAIANFLTFNHDTGKFEIVSSGSVSPDGSSIESDPGSGITVAGWGGICPPYPAPNKVKRCAVKISPTELIVCVGERAKFEVSGGPGPGTLTWIADGNPNTASTSADESFGSLILKGETSFASPGEKTISAFFDCGKPEGGSTKFATAKVFVVEVQSITATVPHIVNPSPCVGVADLPDDVFVSGLGVERMDLNPPLALPRKTKTVMLEAQLNFPGKVPLNLKWKVKRNADDAELFGVLPVLTAAGKRATLETDAQGSFHVYCYCDANANNEPDEGEPMRVLNLALVGVEVTNIVALPQPAELVQGTPAAAGINIQTGLFDFSQPSRAATYVRASVILHGGGADSDIGVDQLKVFFIQNFRNDNFTCNYAGGKTGKEVFACDPTIADPICAGAPVLMSIPVLDSDVNFPLGGTAPSAACCRRETEVPGAGSRNRIIEWLDSPRFNCAGTHPCGGGEALASTSGNNRFAPLMLSFSSQAPHSYVLNARADWTVTVSGTVAPNGAGNLIWTKDAAAGITATTSTTGLPQSGSDAGVMVYGPTSIGAGGLKCDAR